MRLEDRNTNPLSWKTKLLLATTGSGFLLMSSVSMALNF